MAADNIPDIDKLRFYRDEIKHEFGLLATRSNILVTCQSFLAVPYAILNTVGNFRAALGLGITLMLVQPMRVGERTINMWLKKKRRLLRGSTALHDLAIERDLRDRADEDPRSDWEHNKSLAFSRYGPWAFGIFWVLAVVVATTRAYMGV